MDRLSLKNLKRGNQQNRREAEKRGREGVRRKAFEHLKKPRDIQMAFRCSVEDRQMIEELADHLEMSFTDLVLDSIRRHYKEIKGE